MLKKRTSSKLSFQVDSRIATLLSQEYASTEKALKELVDNAWDADAEHVTVLLPQPMTDEPIVIADTGCGMTEEELRHHYLFIASDRRERRGERTVGKNRLIKGRKGIGKFAGLMAKLGGRASSDLISKMIFHRNFSENYTVKLKRMDFANMSRPAGITSCRTASF